MKKLTEDDLRAVSREDLDAFRQRLPSMSTGELLVYLVRQDALLDLDLFDSKAELRDRGNDMQDELALAAAMVAVLDEVNLRIPARVKK